MEAKDLPGNRYVTLYQYPKVRGLPLFTAPCETRETDRPFRVGYGGAIRLPLTRWAVIIGEWSHDLPGENDDEKLRAALKSEEVDVGVDVIKEW